MSDLLNKKCVPCEGGILPFDTSEIHKYQKKVDGWDIKKDEKEIFFLNKEFIFKNFIESQKFINEVGVISEKEGLNASEHIFYGDSVKVQLINNELVLYIEKD